jgi:hypothetical protein
MLEAPNMLIIQKTGRYVPNLNGAPGTIITFPDETFGLNDSLVFLT